MEKNTKIIHDVNATNFRPVNNMIYYTNHVMCYSYEAGLPFRAFENKTRITF